MLLVADPFWTLDCIKTFLSAVPNDRMIVVDVNSVTNPAWLKTDSFYRKPFIYSLDNNFGGTIGMYGYLLVICTDPFDAASYKDSSFVGVGITPEAIEQNPVVYDLMVCYNCYLVIYSYSLLYFRVRLDGEKEKLTLVHG